MSSLLASLLAAVLRLHNDVSAAVLAAFAGLALVAIARAVLGDLLLPPRAPRPRAHWRRFLASLGYLAFAAIALALGALYATFVLSGVTWGSTTVTVAAATLLVILATLVSGRLLGWSGPGGLTGLLLKAVLVLTLLVLALVTLMRAGFLALTEDRPVLLVELSGKTADELVAWAPAGGALRSERLTTHHVVFRRPTDGAAVGEAWVFGDEIAVKGRVLRLSPILNAAGIHNLFELTFAYNGYKTIERHNTYPHRALPLEPVGPLAVHPMWKKTQERLLQRWESGTEEGSAWVVRSTTTESTFFPLIDPAGQPVKRTYRLVLTPGGLSAS